MYRQLSPEQMTALIEKMASQDLIPDAMFDAVKEEHPDSRVVDVAELLHSLLCKEEHGMEPEDCKYHAENMYPDPCQNPHHRRWVAYTEQLIKAYELDLEGIKGITKEMLTFASALASVEVIYRGRVVDFILDGLGKRLPSLPPVQGTL